MKDITIDFTDENKMRVIEFNLSDPNEPIRAVHATDDDCDGVVDRGFTKYPDRSEPEIVYDAKEKIGLSNFNFYQSKFNENIDKFLAGNGLNMTYGIPTSMK